MRAVSRKLPPSATKWSSSAKLSGSVRVTPNGTPPRQSGETVRSVPGRVSGDMAPSGCMAEPRVVEHGVADVAGGEGRAVGQRRGGREVVAELEHEAVGAVVLRR